MEKTYTNAGYSFTNARGQIIEVSREQVVKALEDQGNLLANVQTNIANLNIDLQAIDNA